PIHHRTLHSFPTRRSSDLASTRAEKIELPPGLNSFVSTPTAFSPDGNRLLMSHESSVNPADIWVYDIAKRSAAQLTFSAIASLEDRKSTRLNSSHRTISYA